MRPGRARRCPPASAAGPTRPPHAAGTAARPRPICPTRTARPAPPGQDREGPGPLLAARDSWCSAWQTHVADHHDATLRRNIMNGAQALVRTLADCGVETAFSN